MGCRKVSPGCDNCYAARDMKRYGREFDVVTRAKDATFYAPLRWKEPRRIFVCSWSDFFILGGVQTHERAWETMLEADHHTYMILTKRLGLMAAWSKTHPWPDHIWAGASVESQKYAPRLDVLARVPAKVRFVSAEPLLSNLDIRRWLGYNPSHEVEELRRYCLQCGYQWRTDNRPAWPYLEDSVEAGRQVEQGYNRLPRDPTSRRAPPSHGVPSNTVDDQPDTGERVSPSPSLQTFLWPDSARPDGQSQERGQGRQPPGESRTSDPSGTADALSTRFEARAAGPKRREEPNGQADRCPSCGDSLPTWRRGTTYLDSFGFWHRFPNRLQDSTGSAPLVSWTISGGESGPGARPMHPDWPRSLRDQCATAGVPFFYKQAIIDGRMVKLPTIDGVQYQEIPSCQQESVGQRV